jgi:hypothetical protein
MSSGKPEINVGTRCWDCGAENDAGASECWLCQRRDWWQRPGPAQSAVVMQPRKPSRPLGSISGLMIFIALVAVILGLWQTAPGLSIVLFFALPAWGLTELKAYRRRRRGEEMSGAQKLVWIICLTVLLPIVLITALVAALFVICSSANMAAATDSVGPIAVVVVFVVLFLAAFLAAVFYRTR